MIQSSLSVSVLLPRICVAISCLVAATAICAAQEVAEKRNPTASVSIESVDVGIAGQYKIGKWTNVTVLLKSDQAVTGKLVLATQDGEGVGCQFVSDGIELKAGTNSIHRQIRLGQGRKLDVRWQSPESDVANFELALPEPITAWQQWVLSIGTDVALSDTIRLIRRPSNEGLITSHLADRAKLPTNWLSYDGVDLVVFTTGDAEILESISDRQYAAIRQWVAEGGRMLISTATNAPWLMGNDGPLAAFAPGSLETIKKQQQTSGLEALAKTSVRLDSLMEDAAGRIEGMPMAVFQVDDGVVEAEEGFGGDRSAWLIRHAYGMGIVTILTADVDLPPIADPSWTPRNRLMAELVQRALPGRFDAIEEKVGGQLAHVGYGDMTGQLRSAMEQYAGVRLVPFSLVAAIAVAFVILIGPVDYFLLRQWHGRMSLTWITFPLLVVAVSALAMLMAHRWKGPDTRLNEVQIVDLDCASSHYRGSSWTHVFSPRTQAMSINQPSTASRLISGARVSSNLFAWQGLPGDGFGGMSARSRHGGLLRPYDIDISQKEHGMAYRIQSLSMPKWSSRSFSGTATGEFAQLDFGLLSQNRDGLLRGEVRNPLTVVLRDAAVCHDRWIYRIGDLKAGASFNLQNATPKDLRSFLTKRTILSADSSSSSTDSSKEISSQWDPQSQDLGRILQIFMFHDAAGGRARYTDLLHRFESRLDMSDLIKTRRAVLFGKVSRGTTEVALDGEPFEDSKGQRLFYCRLIYTVTDEQRVSDGT